MGNVDHTLQGQKVNKTVDLIRMSILTDVLPRIQWKNVNLNWKNQFKLSLQFNNLTRLADPIRKILPTLEDWETGFIYCF